LKANQPKSGTGQTAAGCGCLTLVLVIAVVVVVATIGSSGDSHKTPNQGRALVVPRWPTKSYASAVAWAKRHGNDLSILSKQQTSFPPCACRVLVEVPRESARQRVADLLRTFTDQNLGALFEGNGIVYDPGSTLLLGYYSPYNDSGFFTAGRITLDLDNRRFSMEIDVGPAGSAKSFYLDWKCGFCNSGNDP
jgi:hypothetical protein